MKYFIEKFNIYNKKYSKHPYSSDFKFQTKESSCKNVKNLDILFLLSLLTYRSS